MPDQIRYSGPSSSTKTDGVPFPKHRLRMFTQLASADNLSKSSTMVFRIGTDAHLYDYPDDVSITPLLDSKFESGEMRSFQEITYSISSPKAWTSLISFLRRPNEALLSINCFQRDLGDPNPLVRAWALRTMAGIRLHVIAPLVLVALGKCAGDPSVYDRECAANALAKLNDLYVEENATAIDEVFLMYHIVDLRDDKGDMSLTKDKFLVICESLASKMLSMGNLFLVSVEMPVTANLDDSSGLCLRLSGEILSHSTPILIIVTL